ncbi:MAG: serine protease [Clostridia bacterium]|nr:serine protease [Clostridia bacterium]
MVTAAPTATIEPTQEPQVTPIPTAQPTAVPTAVPTVKPTAKPTAAPTATKAPSSDDDYTTDSISTQEQTAWNLLNADRTANGLPALPLDAELSRIARIKSQDMRDNNYFAHESPTYGNVRDMLRTFGYSFTAAGENIAHHASVAKAQAAFMSSTGHRQNILSTTWTKVGIGIALDPQGYPYLTQIFAK